MESQKEMEVFYWQFPGHDWTVLPEVSPGDHKKVPSEEMLPLSSEVHWGRSEWAVPYLAFCELQIDYRRLSKKRTSTLLISKEVFFSIVTKGFKFLKVPKQKHVLSCSSKKSSYKLGILQKSGEIFDNHGTFFCVK